MKVVDNLKYFVFKKIWRLNNKHNDTMPAIKYTFDKVEVGKGTYGCLYKRIWE